jgi:hypothetical protein
MYHQMMEHFKLYEPDYIKPNVKPFTRIEDWNFTTLKNEGRKDYRDDSFPAVQVPKYVFIGFEKLIIAKNKLEKTKINAITNVTTTQIIYYPFVIYHLL